MPKTTNPLIKMITVRKAKPEDAPIIIDFQQKMAWETEKVKLDPAIISIGVRVVFRDPAHGQYYVAEYVGVVVASLLITYEWSDWRNADVWWFQSVYVLPEYRRRGIFRKMFSKVMEEADKNGAAGLRLYVELNNTNAQKTYEALGMTKEHYTMYELMKNK